MPFKKGEGGRQKGARNRASANALEVFLKLGGVNGKLYAEQLHTLATAKHDDPHVRLKALAIIAPYIWGKPVERHEVTGPEGGPIPTTVVHELHTT